MQLAYINEKYKLKVQLLAADENGRFNYTFPENNLILGVYNEGTKYSIVDKLTGIEEYLTTEDFTLQAITENDFENAGRFITFLFEELKAIKGAKCCGCDCGDTIEAEPEPDTSNIATVELVRNDGKSFNLRTVYIFDVFNENTYYTLEFPEATTETKATFTFGPVDTLQAYGVHVYYDIGGEELNQVFTFKATSWEVLPKPFQQMQIEVPEAVEPEPEPQPVAKTLDLSINNVSNNPFAPVSIECYTFDGKQIYTEVFSGNDNYERFNHLVTPLYDYEENFTMIVNFNVNGNQYVEDFIIPSGIFQNTESNQTAVHYITLGDNVRPA